ncbi:hypothetical protein NL676_034988 [Syzygium grande]|nr:hypothetical protein NL676_034988 [Syzygium grande]
MFSTRAVQARVRTFRDKEEISDGESISKELRGAIKRSKIGIPILSKDYASSKWCLRELAQMVEQLSDGMIIMPVFFEIPVDHVKMKNGEGPYAAEIEKYKEDPRVKPHMIKEWVDALQKVPSLKGRQVDRGFLGDIEETSAKKGLEALQNTLVSDITRRDLGAFNSVEEGVSILKDRFSTLKVLILLDDVNEKKQLDALVRNLKWFGSGSSLLSLPEYRDDRDFWEALWKKLEELPDDKVQNKLKIPYDQLSRSQRHIFLDIACYLNGEDKRIASYMWDELKLNPKVEIDMLGLVSMVKVGDDNRMWMHEQLGKLGRQVVQDDLEDHGNCSRLYEPTQAREIIQQDEWTGKLKVLILRGCVDLIQTPNFSSFKALEILAFEHCSHLVHIDPSIGLLKCLQILDLKFCPELSNLPAELDSLEALRELRLDGTSIENIPV